jgi:hypothetical protein
MSGLINTVPVTGATLFAPNTIIGKSVKIYDPATANVNTNTVCGTIILA